MRVRVMRNVIDIAIAIMCVVFFSGIYILISGIIKI